MMEENSTTIRTRTLWILVGALTISVIVIWCMSLFIFGSFNFRNGAQYGRDLQARVNPSQEYIESGQAFCHSEGNWVFVRPVRGGFKIRP